MPAQSEKDAVKKVDKHVSPKECFIWFMSTAKGYEPIPGTGCAHWVAHEKGWKGGKEGSNGCKEKYLLRVKDVAAKAGKQIDLKDVAVGNVWVSDKGDHCGIVSKVTAAKPGDKDSNPAIEICHCSSKQGKVSTNDWATYFKGGGKFYQG